jgi:hypothetical protein
MKLRFAQLLCIFALAISLSSTLSVAQTVVFINDFETNTNGFTSSGTLPPLTRTSLPTDGGGLASPNQSTWLGRLGDGVGKSASTAEIVTLNVSGLVPGQVHFAEFDLLVGASWDGSAPCCGPDKWRFAIDGVRLIDTTFTNGNQFQEYGLPSPQKYSDTTYTNPDVGPDWPKFTGADASFTTGTTAYSQHYGIYHFGHGLGNPILAFVPLNPTATLEFARYGNNIDSGDEYWALDNVRVWNGIPEPSSFVLLSLAAMALAFSRRRPIGH